MRIAPRSIFLLFLLASFSGSAQQSEAIKNYIAVYKDLAIAEMKRTGVPASITLAQGIHESGAGMGKLVLASNNHFGIKCKSNWTGESVRHNDDAKGECFRKYPKPEDSYRDHSDFLKNGQRYAFLFQLDPTDYTGWANGLKQAGYATNPKYPQVLIKMVEDYGLQEYTLIALGKKDEPAGEIIAEESQGTYTAAVPPVEAPQAEPDKQKNDASATKINYPEGQFTINETKVVYVKKGTPYLSIARQYNVDLSKLFEFNELDRAEETEKDQLVYLQRKRKTGANEYHVMKPGEALHDIAQQQGIRLETLLELNWLTADAKPAPGERLHLKKKAASMPKLVLKDNYSLIPTLPHKSTN